MIGRAVAVLSGEGNPGSLNFDLEDDPMGPGGGKTLLEATLAGKLGSIA